ncbi:MAG: hypothetical protein JW993_13160 [Sedimentisphaerales bacterium]|nr:hypothetical protein [Sedimentisphaerales bacterium]
MLRKVLGLGIAGLLAVALVGGSAYILLRPAEAYAESERVSTGGQGHGQAGASEAGGQGQGHGQVDASEAGGQGRSDATIAEATGNGRGGGRWTSDVQHGGNGSSGDVVSEGFGLENPAAGWISISGSVVSFEEALVIATDAGEMTLELGQSRFWDENGISLKAGDDIVAHGFYEGADFEVGAVENLTTGETVALRDETGRPLWAGGRGRG